MTLRTSHAARGPVERPIFVFGCPRSGTTLLTLMLHSHSQIAMPPETRFLMAIYRRRREFGDLNDRENRRKLARAIVRGRGARFRHLELDRRVVKRRIVQGEPTVGTALGTVYRSYAERFGKPRWGDKRPTYFRDVAAIRELFPDAQFVHLVRDGRDCAASLKRMSWWRRDGRDAIDAIAWWSHAIDCGRRAARRLPADSFYELQYERLVADPEGELRRLCAFLGEEFEPGMLESHRVAAQLPPRQRLDWHANTSRPVNASRVGTYAEGLDDDELRLVERVAASRLRRLGYSVPAERRRPSLRLTVKYWIALLSLRIRTRVLEARDRRTARPAGSMADRGVSRPRARQPR